MQDRLHSADALRREHVRFNAPFALVDGTLPAAKDIRDPETGEHIVPVGLGKPTPMPIDYR